MLKVSVIGLGKLGLPLAATIASKGFFVSGVDINSKIIENLKKGKTILKEPGLLDLIKKYNNRIIATDDISTSVLNSEISFIITPTPSKSNGYFSTKYVESVLKNIAKVLRKKKNYHLVVVVSTVMPGSTDKFKKLLEDISGKSCGKDFGLCYNPEFIALGSVIYDLLNPDLILIGESDQNSGDILQRFYKKFCDNKPQIARMNFINAELTKISINTFITTKISYANMLAEICEKLPGGNVDQVTFALGLDSRIGKKYLRGGPAFGGPCFPRDNIAFISLAKNIKSTYAIAHATHKINTRQIDRLIKIVTGYLKKGSRVGILGLSYKPFTDVVEESMGLILAKILKDKKIRLILHDPLALENAEKVLGNSEVEYVKDLKDCVTTSDILVIATNWPEYRNIKENWFEENLKVVIDPWRMIDATVLTKNVTYLPWGLNI